MLSVRRQSGGIVPDLPPAVCHSEGDGHGRPFAPVGWRLLAVPENDDLERRGEGILQNTETDTQTHQIDQTEQVTSCLRDCSVRCRVSGLPASSIWTWRPPEVAS